LFTRLRRTLLIATAVMVGTVCLTGCGGGDEDSGGNNTSENNTGENNTGGNNTGGSNIVWDNNCTSAATCKQVTIGTQTWMAENLNVETTNSKCYENKPDSCAKYGRYYSWDVAQTVCPAGWRLPDTADWMQLIDFVGGSSTAGAKLKSTSGWIDGNGTDEYGFSALPGGIGSVGGSSGGAGDWWTATPHWSGGYLVAMSWGNNSVRITVDGTLHGNSVRCVKANYFRITFDPTNGTVTPASVATGTDGKLTNLPTPTRKGYAFNGWFTAATGGAEITTSTVFSESTTIYAQWTPNNNCTSAETCKQTTIGGQTWTAENLNMETVDSWCYDNNADNCAIYGRLYTWEAAKAACQLIGWRLPTNQEWQTLVDFAGGSSTAGTKLKSIGEWYIDNWRGGDETDEYGFSALPGGNRISGYGGVGTDGFWWTITEFGGSGSSDAYFWSMNYGSGDVYGRGRSKDHGISVRCVAD